MTLAVWVAATAVTASGQAVPARPALHRAPEATVTAEAAGDDLESLVAKHFRPLVGGQQAVGMVVGVVDGGGRRVFAFGETAKGSGRRPGGDTVFELGSVSKIFTALMLADAHERNIVRLDDPLEKHLAGRRVPEFRGKRILLRHLASHTSGLPRLPDNHTGSGSGDPYTGYTTAQLYDFLASHSLRRAPGEQWEYSKAGISLLGHALAARESRSYEGSLADLVRRMGLKDTVVELDRDRVGRAAHGYAKGSPVAAWTVGEGLAPSAGLRSTADDLLTLVAASAGLEENPLAPALRRMQDSQVRADSRLRFGLGWAIASLDGHDMYGHDGTTAGCTALVLFVPDKKVGLVVLANARMLGDVRSAGQRLLSRLVQR